MGKSSISTLESMSNIKILFIDWHYQEIKDNIDSFNVKLMDYLVWYNTRKQHSAIGKIPPLRYYVNCLIKNINLPPNLLYVMEGCKYLQSMFSNDSIKI